MAWSVPYTLMIVGLVAAPSLIARGVHETTGDPLWRYLAIDEEGLASSETDIESDGPYVRVRIFWGGPDGTYDTAQEVVEDLRKTFEGKGVDSFIAVMDADGEDQRDETTVFLRAGSNGFGPFPVWDAPRHIQPAVHAAHLAFRPAATEATEDHRW